MITSMDTSLDKIKQLLKNKTGLDSSTIGNNTLEKILKQRMQHCNIESFDDYYRLVTHNSDELNELLEISVIPETWFFRDTRPFEVIYRAIQRKLLSNSSSKIDILSIPCSTGEEACSIAMYLIDKGIPPSAFHIDAIDISSRALQYARQGIYSDNSFRGKEYKAYQEKYFAIQNGSFRIDPRILQQIHYRQQNILAEIGPARQYDFILCRNLLIYFDANTKNTAFLTLSTLLKNDGLLFIGHSELGSIPDKLFQNQGSQSAFALIKPEHPEYNRPDRHPEKTETSHRSAHHLYVAEKKPVFQSASTTTNTDTTDTDNRNSKQSLIQQARRLANANKFDRAQSACMKYIERYSEDSEILFLLGLIASSQNKNHQAESQFRKALFLDPAHYESLTHLSLLLNEQGDHKNAELLKKRARRVLARE